MIDITEYRRLKFFEALRFVLALAVCLAVIAFLALSAGCAGVPEEMPPGAYDFITNSVQRAVSAAEKAAEEYSRRDDGAGQTEDPATTSAGEHEEHGDGAQASSDSPDSPSSPVLVFKYGGFKGDKAVEDSRCRISQLKIGSDALSFRWDTKIPGDWKRETLEKGPMIVVAAFVWDGGRWIGGKFDWIDESRSSRSLENIKGGYGGWDGTSWTAAKRHAVCVVSADGKFRSNLLTD